MRIKMDKPALEAFVQGEFTQVADDFRIHDVEAMRVLVGLIASDKHLRPGGTVSGPAMFALADVSVYFAILAMIGPVALAVTTNCSIDFMRKPQPGELLCEARLLKLGRVLAVGDALIYTDGAKNKPVARASLTYSVPPRMG